MFENSPNRPPLSRRGFFDSIAGGLAGAALASLSAEELLGKETTQAASGLEPKAPHFRASAKSVIHLCMQGGPSQVDLFDPKPALDKFHGKVPPRELTENAVFENDRNGALMKSPFKFAKRGKSGAWVSDLLPGIAGEVDELAIIRSMYNVHPNHEPAIYKWQTGKTFPGHPALGSWITYGLGSENQNLPAYLVLADPIERLPTNGVENWTCGYLPPLYQGTPMRPVGSPLLNLRPDYQEPASVTSAKRDLVSRLDRMHRESRRGRPVLDARIANYELAARMQVEATEALDVSKESAETLKMYGIGEKNTDSFGRRCLLARRLIERGVRFISLFPKGQAWDNHRNIASSLPDICGKTDKPIAGLLKDLRQRGLLDETLVLWGGEFGRLPTAQVQSKAQYKTAGRDHGPYGFSCWMAGGGVKGGTVYGATDDFGYASVENRVGIQDWHATVLHLLGLKFDQLAFERNGLDEKLTHQYEPRIVKEILK